MWAMIGCSIAMAIWTAVVVYLSVREEKLEARNRELPTTEKGSVELEKI